MVNSSARAADAAAAVAAVTAAQSTRVGPAANGDAAAGGEANGAANGHGNGNGHAAAADLSDAELEAAGATVVATLSALRSTASHPPPLVGPARRY